MQRACVFPLVRDIDIDGVVAVGTANLLLERQVHHLRALAQPPFVSLATCQASTVDAALLTGTDTDGLTILDVAYRVALCIFQCDESDDEITLCISREVLVLCRDVLEECWVVQFHLVATLLEGDTEHLFALDRSRSVVRVDLDDVVSTLALLLQDFDSLWGIARSDDAIAYLTLDEEGCSLVTHVAQCHEVTIRAHTVGTTGTNVGTSQWGEFKLDIITEVNLLQGVAQWQSHCCASWRNVLETCCGWETSGSLELLDQLLRIEGIEEVDVARTAVNHFDREFASILHEDSGRLLVRITSVLEC